MRRLPLVLLGFVLSTSTVFAEVKLPAVFSDHAVLQRGVAVPVWGWAEPGEKVAVTLGSVKAEATADGQGRWRVALGPLEPGEPRTLVVEGGNRIEVKDVLVGDVWLCSGQSNMAMTVNRCKDFEKEQAQANYPKIRMFKTAATPAREPQQDCTGAWVVCSPDTVSGFSGTAYFFAREVHGEVGVPVGLLNSSVGGTAIEAWTSMDAQKNVKELSPVFAPWDRAAADYDEAKARADYDRRLADWKVVAAKARAEQKQPPRRPQPPVHPRVDRNHPANLFNGMIAPLVPYAIKGAIWYQGERNARNVETAELYRTQLPLLIKDWRTRWGQGDFPFYYVQLPNFKKPTDDPGAESAWAVMRESMRQSLSTPSTGMAITIDVGEEGDIHPKNKQDVGKRLALLALARVYDKKGPVSGPLVQSAKVENAEVVLTFEYTGGTLKTQDGGKPIGFALADADGKWHWAEARIEGDTVVVSHPDVKTPRAVRYAWADNPRCNLCNAAGLPASPFEHGLSR